MKLKTQNLYLAYCRKNIMDIIMDYYENEKRIDPRPDYVDYYTIVYRKNDGTFVDLFNNKTKFSFVSEVKNLTEHYDSDLLICYEPLNNYLTNEKINKKEAYVIYDVISKTRKLAPKYGYKSY